MQQDFENPGFETGKIWAIGWGVAAFLSLASGGILGAIAFGLLAFDSIAEGERDDDDDRPPHLMTGSNSKALPAAYGNPFEPLPNTPPPFTGYIDPFAPFDQASEQAAEAFTIPDGVDVFAEPQEVPRMPVQPPVSVQVSPAIDIHNHIEPAAAQRAVRTASPAQSDRRTLAPDLSMYPDPKQRMQVLLKAMAQSGFPVGSLINHPFVWCWGRSQSGKTTIAIMLAMARLAMGHKISYFTTDDDYPSDLKWSRVEDSAEGYAFALDDVTATIVAASKGKLAGNGWVFDEMFAAYTQHGVAIQPLLTAVLMKGAKTRSGSIGISQADTSSAHGLKGIDAAWRDERVSIQALHVEDALGNRQPTGRYLVARGETDEEWILPEWMLTELNQWGSPDPVVWMQRHFPELGQTAFSGEPKNTEKPFSEPKNFRVAEKAENPIENRGLSPVEVIFENDRKTLFTRFSVPFEQAKELVEKQVETLGKTEAIKLLWGVSPGSSKAYQSALEEYKILTGEE
jgi:hypothetical protein